MIANPLEREVEQMWLSLCELRFGESRPVNLLPNRRLVMVGAPDAQLVGNYTNRITLAEFRADVEFCLWQKEA